MESVPLDSLKVQLNALPKTQNQEARAAGKDLRKYVQNLPHAPSKRTASAAAPRRVRLADSGRSRPGVLLDFYTVLAATNTMVFQSDTTYYVSGTCTLSGTSVIEGGTVIKYTNANNASLSFLGPVTCATSPYNPAIFTAKDDDSVGEKITASTGAPTNYYATAALVVNSGPSDLKFLRVGWAAEGILYQVASGSSNNLSHSQFMYCGQALLSSSPTLYVRNALFYNVQTNFSTTTTGIIGQCEHLTVDMASRLNGAAGLTLNVTNSILASITNSSAYNGAFNDTYAPGTAGIFASAGSALHYLPTVSPSRGTGTPNVSSQVLTDLASFGTTEMPVVLSNSTISLATTWLPQVARGNSGSPTKGYHYPALDYLATAVTLQNTLTLSNGVAVAFAGNIGLTLGSVTTLVSEGLPQRLNHLVRHLAVQEQAKAWGATPSSFTMFAITQSTPLPILQARFTEVSLLADSTGKRSFISGGAGAVVGQLALSDCQVRSWYLNLIYASSSGMSISMTNNLFRRCSLSFSQQVLPAYYPITLTFYNNLFLYGTTTLSYFDPSTTWTAKDNAFDNVALTCVTNIVNQNNGYINTTALGGGVSNVVVGTFTYANGPLGANYQSSANFVNAGSRLSGNAGLYHYTTQAAIPQTKEGATVVDIGFHYVATDNSGLPLDTDGDGVADYGEDRNGNGIADAGETNWQVSGNGTTGVPGLQVFTPME